MSVRPISIVAQDQLAMYGFSKARKETQYDPTDPNNKNDRDYRWVIKVRLNVYNAHPDTAEVVPLARVFDDDSFSNQIGGHDYASPRITLKPGESRATGPAKLWVAALPNTDPSTAKKYSLTLYLLRRGASGLYVPSPDPDADEWLRCRPSPYNVVITGDIPDQ